MRPGGVRERPNRTVSKTVVSFGHRGFKSHPLRSASCGAAGTSPSAPQKWPESAIPSEVIVPYRLSVGSADPGGAGRHGQVDVGCGRGRGGHDFGVRIERVAEGG